MTIEQSARLAALAAILLAVASCASLLYKIARESAGLLLFGMSLLLVATNAGYYLRLLGSEVFAFALVAAAVWLAWFPKEIGNSELAGLSALSSLLVTVRPQSIIMASPAIVLGLLRWAGQRPRPPFAKAFLFFIPPVAFGLYIVFQLNYWMAGAWTASAVSWGHSEFKPVDLSARYLSLVLFDQRSGALRYTPFMAVGLLASLWHIFDRTLDKSYRGFYTISLLAGLAQVWIISGFYFWSGGMQGFGSRYLNLLSLYGVISVIHILASERIGLAVKALVVGISAACAAYTAALFPLPYNPLPLIAGGAGAAAWLSLSRKEQPSSALDLAYGCLGISILCSILAYYALRLDVTSLALRLDVPTKVALMLIGGAAIIIAIPLYLIWSLLRSSSAKILAIVSVLALVTEFSLIVRLRIGAAPYQARQLASPSPQFLYKNHIELQNLARDVQALEEVYKWSAADRYAITEFLENEKRRTAIRN